MAMVERDTATAMRRGFFGRCPNCGQGKLFRAFLKVADKCAVCGEDFSHHRADDAPAYFNIVIVGHIVVPLALAVETVLRARLIGFILRSGFRSPSACPSG